MIRVERTLVFQWIPVVELTLSSPRSLLIVWGPLELWLTNPDAG